MMEIEHECCGRGASEAGEQEDMNASQVRDTPNNSGVDARRKATRGDVRSDVEAGSSVSGCGGTAGHGGNAAGQKQQQQGTEKEKPRATLRTQFRPRLPSKFHSSCSNSPCPNPNARRKMEPTALAFPTTELAVYLVGVGIGGSPQHAGIYPPPSAVRAIPPNESSRSSSRRRGGGPHPDGHVPSGRPTTKPGSNIGDQPVRLSCPESGRVPTNGIAQPKSRA
ncbi:hypothetical protein AXG93_4804s1220 [Marchantia polymorpha subsp. ruderalis]|uniref:Uncharacterized protein n=1 Tax=Marchantia polymorpha subsp. ruderalis TaxID=1480154 RepID=A0A176VN28_MARPO|nr:hypothetical protein AXG93_4804s1220 [Marchantia polymorpha subsp. ruderalis]